jgi:hypothetical protein
VDLLPKSLQIKKFVTFDAIQAKENNYRDQHPKDQFLPLTIEVFGCLHKQAYVFLHDHANAIWSFKRPKGPPIFIFVTFFYQFFYHIANNASILHLI